MTIIEILLAVLIITACAVCIYLVVSLKKLNQSIEVLQKDVHDIYEKTIPLLENLTAISEKTARITNEAENYWQNITETIDKVRSKISHFGRGTGIHSDTNPIEDFVKNLRAIFKGIRSFVENIRK